MEEKVQKRQQRITRRVFDEGEGLTRFSESRTHENIGKSMWNFPSCLTACLTACWLGSENGKWRRFFIEIHAKHAGTTREGPI